MSVTIIAIHAELSEAELVEILAGSTGHRLLDALPVDSEWWVAEDDRSDRSDCDSAVFCGVGRQVEARAAIVAAGLDR